ncbi:MAG: toll/interleukin-1 receptor domain-containing protein [Myxococcales bacterium]|nr:toll/interleukin-1 receptor domain-containing protein [Myxococcota bacterium]MDW8284401.1 toll/interleukin-1 receptor domain-containing protein [Myxococcales bacterium]
MPGIFISYRREDSAGYAGRLADALEWVIPAEQVFRDVDDIRAGEDFVRAIEACLRRVDVVLVLIGPLWSSLAQAGRRRLDDPEDYVRLEIRQALSLGKRLIPVLLGGARMPSERELPEDIRPLARLQAVELSEAGWAADVARLIRDLGPVSRAPSRLAYGWRRVGWVLAAILLGLFALVLLRPPQEPAGSLPDSARRLQGGWTAEVRYDWGEAHQEVFQFELVGQELRGSASYLGVRRAIREGQIEGERIRFVTASQEMLGGEDIHEVTHHYHGVLDGEVIRFTLDSRGGVNPHPTIFFVAVRLPP